MALEIVKAKQKIDFVVFKNCEGHWQFFTCNFHVTEMDTSKNFRLTNTISYTSISGIHHVQDVASFCTVSANNCALSATINECLNRFSIHFHIYIKHRYLTKKFRMLLHRQIIILLDSSLTNFLFNFFLSFSIIRICIEQFKLPLLLFPILEHLLFHAVSDYFEQLVVIALFQGFVQFGHLLLQMT